MQDGTPTSMGAVHNPTIQLSQRVLEFILHIFTNTYLLYLHLYPYLQHLFKSKVLVIQFQCSLFLQLQEISIILS